MKKILVVNVNWLGDVVFSLPVFKALKETYPHSRISCLAPSRVKEILESSSYVDQIICYDERGAHRSFLKKLQLIQDLRREKFDIAFLLHRSFTRALLVFLAGIPLRVGYDTKKRGFLLTRAIKPLDSLQHRSDIYLYIIESFGIEVRDRRCELLVSDQALTAVAKILRSYSISTDDFLVVIHPGGNWDLKRWPKEKFAFLTSRLIKEFQAKVIVVGSQDDASLAQEIFALAEHKPVLLTGMLTLKELLALMKKASVVVSADSGPLHLSAAVRTPVIGLFGPTHPAVTGVRGGGRYSMIQKDVGCNREPCYYLDCPDNICMRSIEVDDVIKEIKKIRNS